MTAAGLLLNLVAIPAMAVAQISGLVAVVVGPWAPAIGHLSAFVAARAAHWLLASSALVDAWPWLSWRVPPVSVGWIAAYYVAACAAWWSGHRRATDLVPLRRAAHVAAVIALAVIALAPAAERTRPAPGRLRVSLIDVGQGDATLVQLPNGDTLLVDAGGSPGAFDIGSRVVTPAAWALGVRRLTWLALTHPDIDHIGGAVGVTEDLAPREMWEGIPVATRSGSPADPGVR